jgi:hypothetical protein
MMRSILVGMIFLFNGFLLGTVSAHESQPGSLEMKQLAPDRYDIIWRAPIYYGRPHPAQLQLPEDWETIGQPTERRRADAIVFNRVITTGGKSIEGKIIRFPGLEATITDVFIRLKRLDGTMMSTVARPTKPWAELRGERPWYVTAGEYLGLGFHHILMGIDHLLFLNAAIALSILFLGPEVVRSRRGETSLTIRFPWLVAFAFGLLHGFGFASGLSTTGMPKAELPWALLWFNVGVELGQLVFVFLALALAWSFKTLEVRWPRWAQALPGYTVGSLGAYWTIQRTVILLGGLF